MRSPLRFALATLLFVLLAPSLHGCGTPSPQPPSVLVSTPRLPPPDPRLMEPPPTPGSFSEHVRSDLSNWANRLTGSPPK